MGVDGLGGRGGGASSPFSFSEVDLLAEDFVSAEDRGVDIDGRLDIPPQDGEHIYEVSAPEYVELGGAYDTYELVSSWLENRDDLGDFSVDFDIPWDGQKSAVYAWERKFAGMFGRVGPVLSDRQIFDLVREWSRFYNVSVPNLYRTDRVVMDATAEYVRNFEDDVGTIFIGNDVKRSDLPRLVAHEFAHHASIELKGDPTFHRRFGLESHGPEFMNFYSDILERSDFLPNARLHAAGSGLRVASSPLWV